MGIDPITHKPLSNNANHQTQDQTKQQLNQPLEEEQENQQVSVDFDPIFEPEFNQNKELKKQETSIGSSKINEAKVEDNIIRPLFDTMDDVMNGFCTDEVPIIEPHEILVPCIPSSSSTSTSSSNSTNFLEELQLPDFEWSCNYNSVNNNMELWDDDDDFIISLNFLINGGDKKQVFDAPHNQYPKMAMDSESWAYGLF
ncbi:hypothetical protein TanjilG_32641 [Lupinus angustifolius]|uniref:Uncharacterized protein n=2 Tax=Lupinus angustifolius TaxID=3871 RepID=A0A4P1R944_LUPAN|nr:hypothetical protein TanjilG_32641 [Lupinus angustifolius]